MIAGLKYKEEWKVGSHTYSKLRNVNYLWTAAPSKCLLDVSWMMLWALF